MTPKAASCQSFRCLLSGYQLLSSVLPRWPNCPHIGRTNGTHGSFSHLSFAPQSLSIFIPLFSLPNSTNGGPSCQDSSLLTIPTPLSSTMALGLSRAGRRTTLETLDPHFKAPYTESAQTVVSLSLSVVRAFKSLGIAEH